MQTHAHFPTEFFASFCICWHFASPILTHSLLLAALCQTPAITTMFPMHLHGNVIGRLGDGSRLGQWWIRVGLRGPCGRPAGPAEDVTGTKGWMQNNGGTQQHTWHGIIQLHKANGVPAQAVSTVVIYHLCSYCVAFSWNMLTKALFLCWHIPIHSLTFNNKLMLQCVYDRYLGLPCEIWASNGPVYSIILGFLYFKYQNVSQWESYGLLLGHYLSACTNSHTPQDWTQQQQQRNIDKHKLLHLAIKRFLLNQI